MSTCDHLSALRIETNALLARPRNPETGGVAARHRPAKRPDASAFGADDLTCANDYTDPRGGGRRTLEAPAPALAVTDG